MDGWFKVDFKITGSPPPPVVKEVLGKVFFEFGGGTVLLGLDERFQQNPDSDVDVLFLYFPAQMHLGVS